MRRTQHWALVIWTCKALARRISILPDRARRKPQKHFFQSADAHVTLSRSERILVISYNTILWLVTLVKSEWVLARLRIGLIKPSSDLMGCHCASIPQDVIVMKLTYNAAPWPAECLSAVTWGSRLLPILLTAFWICGTSSDSIQRNCRDRGQSVNKLRAECFPRNGQMR